MKVSELFSVYVVCITGFRSHSGHPIFDEFKNACDILLEQRTLIHHTSRWLSGEYQTLNELLALFLAPFIQKFHSIKEENMSRAINLNGASSFSEESTTQKKVSNHGAKQLGPHMSLSSDDATDTQSISTMNPPASQYPPTLDDFPRRDPYSSIVDQFTHEQHQLQQELMNAVYAYNVKSAVSTLRKMYTKQSKTFRIPVILGLILPDTSAMITNGRNDLLNVALCFILDCIHWCFGVQKGENFESFKYKMNTNIARWLLRECAKKGIPSAVSNVVYNATIKLMNLIMDNYLELNFTYELLQAMNIPQPIPRLIPYIHMWLGSSSSSMKMRVHEFLYEHPEFAPYLAAESNKPYPTHPQLSSFEDGSPHPHDVNDKELEFKLLNLLEKSVNGELGARIPTLYREEYGEPLKLRGRKLKDILMGD